MKRINFKKYEKKIKKSAPLFFVAIMLFSSFVVFSNVGGDTPQTEEGFPVFLFLNVSGKVNGGAVLAFSNESAIDVIKKQGISLRLDNDIDNSIVCVQTLCNSLEGDRWRSYINGNLTNNLSNYTILENDLIEIRYSK